MSRIVDFRDRIITAIKDNISDLRSVDWYDGLFDEKDVDDWIVAAPAAYVAVQTVPTAKHHTTGELNLDLRVVVAIITQDQLESRSSDAEVWDIMEQVVNLANMNIFADPNAAPATEIKFKRLRDPALRREGIALGVVEWSSGLTVGRNMSIVHEYIPFDGTIIPFDPSDFLGLSSVTNGAGVNRIETIDLSPPDDASEIPP